MEPGGTRGIAVVVAAVAALGAVLLVAGRDDPYEVRFTVANAGQLIPGNEVRVGGVAVGSVEGLDLTDDARAEVRISIDDEGLVPLHAGTTATVRAGSLSGVANRYVSLTPGRNDAPRIRSGGAIAADRVTQAVELDQVLNSIDHAAQGDLRAVVRGSATAVDDAGEAANQGLELLAPFLSETAATARELARDERLLTRLLVEAATLSGAAASRPADLDRLVRDTLATADELAGRSGDLEALVTELPTALRSTQARLPEVGETLVELRRLVRDVRPVAAPLSAFLPLFADAALAAEPVVASLRSRVRRPGAANDLTEVVAGLVPLGRSGTPAARALTGAIDASLPIVRDARPYTPDLVGGIFNGFGGTTGGYYDANGHYARVSLQSSLATLTGAGSLAAVSPDRSGLAGYRTGVLSRCPGAATQRAPDGSSPYLDRPDFPCRIEDTPR